jgi:hypothetical protein
MGLSRLNVEILPHGIGGNSVKLVRLLCFVVLLGVFNVSDFLDSLARPYDMYLSLGPVAAGSPILITQGSRFPNFLKAKASPAEPVTVHLFTGKGLPKIRRHPELLDGEFQTIPFSLHAIGHSIVRRRGVLGQDDG